MIRHLTIAVCDACGAEMRSEQAQSVVVIVAALDAGWSRRLSGRLLCPGCTERASCAASGHDYGAECSKAWRACACDRGLPAHSSHEPWQDPTTWDGCGWEWRICLDCDHIDERHVTAATHAARRADDAAADAYLAALERGEIPTQARTEDQPGDGFLAEAAAGLDLPGHQQENRENAMVEGTTGTQRPHTAGDRR